MSAITNAKNYSRSLLRESWIYNAKKMIRINDIFDESFLGSAAELYAIERELIRRISEAQLMGKPSVLDEAVLSDIRWFKEHRHEMG